MAESLSDSDRERIEKCLEIALDNRKFEIDLLWRRTLVFWGFVAVLFVAVAQAAGKSQRLAMVLAILGVVFSFIWSLVNRGSKSWQENWEIKCVQFFKERYHYEGVFRRARIPQDGTVVPPLQSRAYSPSRLLIALSDFSVIFWVGLSLYFVPFEQIFPGAQIVKANAGLAFAIVSALYAVYVWLACRSREGDASGALP